MCGRDRVQALFSGEPIDHLALMPITMQFASHLIGKDYLDYVTDYRVLVEGQIQVAEKFDFDHVSAISDPTREAADIGADIIFEQRGVPRISHENLFLADKKKLTGLKMPSPYADGRMLDRVKAIELFKEKVGGEKYIEGWVEGPCAEGADLRGVNMLMMDFIDDPAFVHDLFAFTNELAWQFAEAQIEAGADIIGIGDAVCSLIGPQLYKEFVWAYEKQLIDRIHQKGAAVRLHICGNITDILEDMAALNCEFVDIDYPVPMATAREKLGSNQIIAGNLNPVADLRDSTPDQILEDLEKCHRNASSKYIVAAGCEIVGDTKDENVYALTQYAKANH